MAIPVFTVPVLDPATPADHRIEQLAAHIARLQQQLDWALRNLEPENFAEPLRKQLTVDS